MDSYRKLCLEKVSEYDQEIPQTTHGTARKRHRTQTASNQLSLPQRDDCKTRKNRENRITKQGPNIKPLEAIFCTYSVAKVLSIMLLGTMNEK